MTLLPKVAEPSEYAALPRDFYELNAEIVAPRLLGHWLIRRTSSGVCAGVIVETEAYLAQDPACHGFKGQTPRNGAMFGPPGHAYVYFIYGMHWCFNAVCQPTGIAEAVLIRAIEPHCGHEWMAGRRAGIKADQWTNGPAKLCAALAIDGAHNAIDLCDPASAVFIAAHPKRKQLVTGLGPLVSTTRVGITQAADWPMRFYLGGSRFVSKRVADAKAPKVGPESC